MTDVIDKLCELHKLDRRLEKLTDRLDSIPQRLQKLQENFQKRISEIEREKESLKNSEFSRKKIELDIEEFENKINTYKIQLQKVKTNEEYKAMEAQIEFSKNKISELETREIELFDEIDAMKTELGDLERRHSAEKERFENEKKNLESEQVRGAEMIKELQKQKESSLALIEPKLLKKYEKIKSARGSALAPVYMSENDSGSTKKSFWICGGCNSMITSQLVEEVKKKQDIAICESCGRILYFE